MKQATITKLAAVVTVVFTVLTFLAVGSSLRASAAATQATQRRIDAVAAADAVQASSALLTNTVRAYTATGDEAWLKKYWTEIDETKSQAKALERLKALDTPAAELDLVAQASANSGQLVKAETRAMRLMLQASRVPEGQMPAAVAAWKLDAKDAALGPDEKRLLARNLVHNADYQGEVAKIMGPLEEFRTRLVSRVTAEADSAQAARSRSEITLAVVAGLLALTLAGILVVFHRQVGGVIQRYSAALGGRDPHDLDFRLEPQGVAELRELAGAFNEQNTQIEAVIGQVQANARTLTTASGRLTDVAEHLESASTRTSTESDSAATSAEEVSNSVSTVAAGTEEMSASIREIATAASAATGVAQEAVQSADATAATVSKLSESSIRIGEVMKAITSIAEQTNLLALNATIEAARAGEAGKGFAVVANEVKELAQQSAAATEDIATRVVGIQDDAAATSAALAGITEVIGRINETQSTIASAVEEQTATTNEISRSVQDAANGSQGIATTIQRVALAARESSSGAAEARAAAAELADLAAQLGAIVDSFSTRG